MKSNGKGTKLQILDKRISVEVIIGVVADDINNFTNTFISSMVAMRKKVTKF